MPGYVRAMAVHTEVERHALEAFLAPYGLGGLVAVEGVPEGSIHTTYRLRTAAGTHYLRLTEGLTDADVAYELALLDHLAATLTPAPRPLPRGDAGPLGHLAGRIATVFSEISGTPVPAGALTEGHARQVGDFLARLHRDTTAFERRRPNPYRPEVVDRWLAELTAAPPDDRRVQAALPDLQRALDASRGAHPDDPGAGPGVGTVHADLFPDNVHWDGERLAGVLDFEMACTAPRLLDLAIALLVWAFGPGGPVPDRARALCDAYVAGRPPAPDEAAAFYDLCRFAAVRYAVSRIRDFLLSPLPPDRLVKKDWRVFRDHLAALERLGPAGLADLTGIGPGTGRTSAP